MIELINRKEIFIRGNNLTSYVENFQRMFFDEDDDINCEMFDALKYNTKNIQSKNFSLMLKHNQINTYPVVLSDKIINLLESLNVKKIILISHLKLDLFGNLEHHYFKVTDSYKELSKITNGKSYKEALIIDRSELQKFIEIFFWLERYDGSVPEYIFFIDSDERFSFYLCKYGNLHFADFTNGELFSEKQLFDLNFEIHYGTDFDQFVDLEN